MLYKRNFFLSLVSLLFVSISPLPYFPSQCFAENISLNQPLEASTPGFSISGPVAAAGPDQLVDEKAKVFLDASNSWPLDTSTTLVMWKQLEGPSVRLSNPEDVRPFFIAPEVGPEGAALIFELTLAADDVISKDTCIINVSWGNIQPTANAAKDMIVNRGDKVFLDGSGSLDPDGQNDELKYQWRQTSGPHVVLSDPSNVKPSFFAPCTQNPVETLTFELIIVDKGGLKGKDSVIVNVSSQTPVLEADAGPNKVVDEGSRFVLDASNSLSQPEKIIKYFWTQLQGPPVTLSDPTAIRPTFLAPSVKNFETVNLVFKLTLTTESGLMSSQKTHIRVDDNWFTSFSEEAFVVPLESKGIGFEVKSGGRIVDLFPSPPPSGMKIVEHDIPYGLFDLKIRTYKPGGEAPLKIYFPEPVPEGYQWFKCQKESTGVGPVPIPALVNPERTTFSILLQDGGDNDEDGTKNSMIRDPSGLGGPFIFLASAHNESRNHQPILANPDNSSRDKNKTSINFNLRKLLSLMKGSIPGFSGQANSYKPETNTLAASTDGWRWLSLQFGPALPLMLLGLLGFISAVLLKKTVRALIASKDKS